MTSTVILSDNGVSSGTAGLKETGGNDGVLILQTTTAGGAATNAVYIDASQNVGIGTSSPATALSVVGTASRTPVSFKGSGSATSYLYVDNSTSGITSTQGSFGASTSFIGVDTSNYVTAWTSGSERARIDSSGNLLVGTTNNDPKSSSVTGVVLRPTNIEVSTSGTGGFFNLISGTGTMFSFRQANNVVGTIGVTASATSYNTSSDYRLKENIAPMTGALSVVSALKPCTYTWKVDGSDGQGFIAHELQDVVPDCVSGEKDAVDADGNPVYQGIDTSFLVATLTAAIQEQQALITQLQADVAALKGTK